MLRLQEAVTVTAGPEAQQKELRELAGVPITPCCMLQNAVCRSANFLCPLRSAWPAMHTKMRALVKCSR